MQPQPPLPTQGEFKNPWPLSTEYDANNQGVLTSVVPKHEKQFVLSLCPVKGTLQIVINKLWQQLTIELKQNGITSFDDTDRFKQFIANIRVTSTGGATTGPMPEASPSNDERREARVSVGDTHVTDKLCDVPSKNERRSKADVIGKRSSKGRKNASSAVKD